MLGLYRDTRSNWLSRAACLNLLPRVAAEQGAGTPPERVVLCDWWIGRIVSLEPHHRTGWVVAQCLEEFSKEQSIAEACHKQVFAERMQEQGLGALLISGPPRKKIRDLSGAARVSVELLDETVQRSMIQAIAKSLPSYIAGIRCWAAFCDVTSIQCHFRQRKQACCDFLVSSPIRTLFALTSNI